MIEQDAQALAAYAMSIPAFKKRVSECVAIPKLSSGTAITDWFVRALIERPRNLPRYFESQAGLDDLEDDLREL